jgi:hypothetical protein
MARKEDLLTDTLPDTLHASEPGLDESLLAQDERRMLRAAMDKLTVPPLFFVSTEPYADIARAATQSAGRAP